MEVLLYKLGNPAICQQMDYGLRKPRGRENRAIYTQKYLCKFECTEGDGMVVLWYKIINFG